MAGLNVASRFFDSQAFIRPPMVTLTRFSDQLIVMTTYVGHRRCQGCKEGEFIATLYSNFESLLYQPACDVVLVKSEDSLHKPLIPTEKEVSRQT